MRVKLRAEQRLSLFVSEKVRDDRRDEIGYLVSMHNSGSIRVN